jgi:hypothetical protein
MTINIFKWSIHTISYKVLNSKTLKMNLIYILLIILLQLILEEIVKCLVCLVVV